MSIAIPALATLIDSWSTSGGTAWIGGRPT
jgi:hypothetical protein